MLKNDSILIPKSVLIDPTIAVIISAGILKYIITRSLCPAERQCHRRGGQCENKYICQETFSTMSSNFFSLVASACVEIGQDVQRLISALVKPKVDGSIDQIYIYIYKNTRKYVR